MVLEQLRSSEMTCSRLLTNEESSQVAISSLENEAHAKVNRLLCLLMKVGWNDLFLSHFRKKGSMDIDMKLVGWIIRGEISSSYSECNDRIRAWRVIQCESDLNEMLNFLRKSNGDINFSDETGQTILHVFLRRCLEYLPKQRSFKVVKTLIENGASVNVVDGNDYTPLHIVAESMEKSLMRLILPSFTNVAATSGFHADTVLHDVIYACTKDASLYEDQYTDIVRTLLAKGANPNTSNGSGVTPVQLAVKYNLFKMLQIFQANKVDFRTCTCDGETMLHLVFAEDQNPTNQLKIIELLVDQGCDVNAKDKNGNSPLHLAAKLRCAKVTERIVQLGGDVHSRTKNLQLTPLHVAASFNQPSNVETLLKAGADVDAEDKNAVTPLHIAASRDGIKSVKCLISYGADVHRRERMLDSTPLHMAASGCKKKVELLLKKGIDTNVSNRDGVTPLHLASLAGNLKVVQILTKHTADVNCRGGSLKLTPLHLTSIWNNAGEAKSLIFNNEDLRHKSFHGMFSWISSFAMDRDNVTVAEWLIKNGSDVNVKDANGRTPLHLATLQRTSNMLEPLLRLGAHVDDIDNERRSPMDNVLKSGSTSGLRSLLKFGVDINDVMTNDSQNEAVDYFLNHGLKLKMLGLPLPHSYNCPTIEQNQPRLLEVEQLKSRMIDGTDISLYDFLHMKERRRTTFAKKVLTMNLEAEFPEYSDVILASCRQAVNRSTLLEPAACALREISNMWWPELCIEQIFAHCNNRHLRALIASTQMSIV